MSEKNSYRERLLQLKEEAWEKEDYQLVKQIRIKIKEYDAKQPKEKVTPYELFEWWNEVRAEERV